MAIKQCPDSDHSELEMHNINVYLYELLPFTSIIPTSAVVTASRTDPTYLTGCVVFVQELE
jgi:predicted transcriptional regulator with HTH domain